MRRVLSGLTALATVAVAAASSTAPQQTASSTETCRSPDAPVSEARFVIIGGIEQMIGAIHDLLMRRVLESERP